MKEGKYLRRSMGTVMLILSIIFLLSVPFLSYADSSGLSEEEFIEVCKEYHAEQSRMLYPPLKNPGDDYFNYKFHYRNVLSADGKSFTDYPGDMKLDRDLEAGLILMDMADGYEVSYEYRISGFLSDSKQETIVEGKTIIPYYKAVPSGITDGSDKQYVYYSNNPEEIPVIPDFPVDYDWKSRTEDTLIVDTIVTVRSARDGSTHRFASRISYVTNLYKEKPDCYSLAPTDIEAYTVKKGDTLQKIAQAYYGNSEEWIYILERNKRYIRNGDFIRPGMLLVIPNAKLIVPPYVY